MVGRRHTEMCVVRTRVDMCPCVPSPSPFACPPLPRMPMHFSPLSCPRRRPFILGGWALTLLVLLYLCVASPGMSAFAYVSVNVGLQTVNLIACCAADGYFIELGQMEPSNKRYGHIISVHVY